MLMLIFGEERLKVIEHVPAGVCQQCGERYFQSSVYKAMEQLASSQVEPDTHLLRCSKSAPP